MIKHDRVSDGRHLMEQEIASLAEDMVTICVPIGEANFDRLFETLAGELSEMLYQGNRLPENAYKAVSCLGRHESARTGLQPVST